jgi:hypothetical protein
LQRHVISSAVYDIIVLVGGALAVASAAVAKQNSCCTNSSSSYSQAQHTTGDAQIDADYCSTALLLDTAGCGTRCIGSNAPAHCSNDTVIQYISTTAAAAATQHTHVLVVGSSTLLTTALQQRSSDTVKVSTDVSTLLGAVAVCHSNSSASTSDSNTVSNSTDANNSSSSNDNSASCVYVVVLVGGVHTVTEQLQLTVSNMHIYGVAGCDGNMPKLVGHIQCTASVHISNCSIMSTDNSNNAAHKRKRDNTSSITSSSNNSNSKSSQTVVVQGSGACLQLTNCSITK